MLNLFLDKISILLLRLYERGQKLRYIEFRTKYQISHSFRFNGKDILFYGDGIIICGDDSYIGYYSTLQAAKNCVISIGKNCAISHNVRIYTSSRIADQNLNQSKDNILSKSGDVIIEDGVWIGANVFINPSIKIGFNSVIGANSVVTKDVPPNSIVGGVPAKLIRLKSI